MLRNSPTKSAGTRSRATRPPVPRPQLGRPDPLDNLTGTRFLWGTMLAVWMVSLLPWRSWPAAPNLLLLVIAFWCVHQSRRVGLITAFLFGLLMDVHDVGPLGQQALYYTLVAYGAHALHRRLLRFDLWSQGMHMLPVFLFGKLVDVLVGAWQAGFWPGWTWLISVMLTAALWPLVGWVLLLPQHRMDDVDGTPV
ncbi:MAG: rod shape-determining protein MreD [Burkholderiaceae bacterium]|nr:rod shape-determining protein MreD [Burkholderiaceae bacterium]